MARNDKKKVEKKKTKAAGASKPGAKKGKAASVAPLAPAGFPEIPPVDFSKFGPVESKPLTRLKRIGAQNLHRSWINIPHVTQFDEADITELEEFRKSKKAEAERYGTRLTLLSFLVKASVVALK